MMVNIQNQNGPEGREIPGDDLALHWYVPFQSPATRRQTYRRPYLWLTGSAMLWGTTKVITNLPGTKSTSLSGLLRSTCNQLLGNYLGNPLANPWFKAALEPLHRATAPRPLGITAKITCWATTNRRAITAVLKIAAFGCAAYAAWSVASCWFTNSQPYQPEGVNHIGLMTEVTQEEALDAPTHFACPAGLRAHIIEKVMMCERSPALIQRVKSLAGKYCDERGVSIFDRPQWIAGACAAAMTVTSHELDLLSYERSWSVQRARKLLRRHHAGDQPSPRDNPGFWQWLLGPGRR